MTKLEAVVMGIEEAASTAHSEFESLGDELRNWHDNMPENLQSGQKGDAIDDAAGTLEGISEINIPSFISDEKVQFQTRKIATSRSERRDEAVAMLQAVAEKLEELKGELEEAIGEVEEAISEAEGVEFPGMFG